MNTTHSSSLAATVPAYAQLQREMHDALRAQHPDWILPNGDCPTCDSYDGAIRGAAHCFIGNRTRSCASTKQS